MPNPKVLKNAKSRLGKLFGQKAKKKGSAHVAP
jgi:hypothetical protein